MAASRLSARPPSGWLAALALTALTAAGCSGGGPQACAFETPVCPDPVPSYSGEVAALIDHYCVGCHGPGGLESNRPFTTWQNIDTHQYAGPMQRQLLSCLMPPADAPQPTDAQKQTMVGWLTCGAPDN